MRVLSFGEILFDIIEGEHYLGGAPLNFAAHLARQGVESYIFSSIGQDELGREALQQIRRIGVKTDFIQQDAQHPTGTVPVEFKKGQPDYTILREVAYDYVDYAESEQTLAKTEFDVLYFGTLAQRNEQSAHALEQLIAQKTFKHIFYDINLRKDCFTAEIIDRSLMRCTILKLNDEEVEVLADMLYGKALSLDEFVRQVAQDYEIKTVIVTAGSKGCFLYEDRQLHFVKGYPATVVDTVGAGDSFSAAFVHQYFKRQDALAAADIANQLGAFVASSRGPLPEYSAEIKEVLEIRN